MAPNIPLPIHSVTATQTIERRKRKRARTGEGEVTVPNDLAEALKGETDVIVAKDAEEEALEAALFGGELELGGSGGWTGLNDDSDDGAPEEFGISQTLFTIDTKGNEREKVQIKEKGHVKFDYGEGEEEESDEEDGEKDGQRSEPEDSDVENNNDALSSEASDSDSSVSEAPAPLERKPAWTDSTDAHHTIDLNDRKITRKLRTNLDESTVSLNEYENRLRRQFDKIHGTKPEWALTQTERAELLGVKRRTTTTSSDEEEEEEEQQGIENLLSTAGGLLNKARRGLEKGRIGMRRMRDANWMAVSEATITSLSFHPSLPTLLTTSLDSTLRLFSLDGQTNPHLQTVKFDMPVYSGVWSGPGEIVVGGRRPWLHTFDVEAGKTARVLFNEATGIKSTEKVAVSPDKSLLAIPGASGTVHVLSGRSKRPIFELQASGDIRDVCLTEKQVWGLSGEGEIYLWDVGERKCVGRWRDYGGQGRNGGRIAVGQGVVVTGNDAGLANVYPIANLLSNPNGNPQPTRTLRNLVTSLSALSIHPTLPLLSLSSSQKRDALRLANLDALTVYQNWPTQATPLGKVQCSAFGGRRGEWFVTGDARGRVRMWGIEGVM